MYALKPWSFIFYDNIATYKFYIPFYLCIDFHFVIHLGPLTYEVDGKATVVGVVSWGANHMSAYKTLPGVYARVTSGMVFINKELSYTCSGRVELPEVCGRKL